MPQNKHTTNNYGATNTRMAEFPDKNDQKNRPRDYKSTPLREGRQASDRRLSTCEEVSIHAPTRGATRGDDLTELVGHVSIHAPTRGAITGASSPRHSIPGFNPRPYERGDYVPKRGNQPGAVSIHAPTRGATIAEIVVVVIIVVSIHAPTRGATLNISCSVGAWYVSIHAPTRGATLRKGFQWTRASVSIHAPTRGATLRQS